MKAEIDKITKIRRRFVSIDSALMIQGSLLERHMATLRSSEVPDSGYFTPLHLTAKDEHSSEGGRCTFNN